MNKESEECDKKSSCVHERLEKLARVTKVEIADNEMSVACCVLSTNIGACTMLVDNGLLYTVDQHYCLFIIKEFCYSLILFV